MTPNVGVFYPTLFGLSEEALREKPSFFGQSGHSSETAAQQEEWIPNKPYKNPLNLYQWSPVAGLEFCQTRTHKKNKTHSNSRILGLIQHGSKKEMGQSNNLHWYINWTNVITVKLSKTFHEGDTRSCKIR